jgi:hypothetical protein
VSGCFAEFLAIRSGLGQVTSRRGQLSAQSGALVERLAQAVLGLAGAAL